MAIADVEVTVIQLSNKDAYDYHYSQIGSGDYVDGDGNLYLADFEKDETLTIRFRINPNSAQGVKFWRSGDDPDAFAYARKGSAACRKSESPELRPGNGRFQDHQIESSGDQYVDNVATIVDLKSNNNNYCYSLRFNINGKFEKDDPEVSNGGHGLFNLASLNWFQRFVMKVAGIKIEEH